MERWTILTILDFPFGIAKSARCLGRVGLVSRSPRTFRIGSIDCVSRLHPPEVDVSINQSHLRTYFLQVCRASVEGHLEGLRRISNFDVGDVDFICPKGLYIDTTLCRMVSI
jgi:hypothetical protein